MITAPSASYSTSCLKRPALGFQDSYLPGCPLPWPALLGHLCSSSSAPQFLTEGGSGAGFWVLLFSVNTPLLTQAHGFRYCLYADDPDFVLPAQTHPLSSSLIHPAVSSTFLLGHVLASLPSHVHSQGLLRGAPPGQLPSTAHLEGPKLGLMLYCHHFEVLSNFLKQKATHFHFALGSAHRVVSPVHSLALPLPAHQTCSSLFSALSLWTTAPPLPNPSRLLATWGKTPGVIFVNQMFVPLKLHMLKP